ncbi:MAG: NAD(P)H-dependent oxidoreductase [Cardiobacteriaceae bacterium]|nr:NAD(P)H-dependent oxidoreductase [Cardiobacteriaceae bacterium]
MAKILMINGSLHVGGFNAQLVNKIVELIGNQAEVSVLDWENVPFYVQNKEFPTPEAVVAVRQMVQQADAIWFVTPEYNYQIPGGLKNLTDWLSRSLDATNPRGESAIHGKITTVSAASADGGSHVRPILEDLLAFIRTQVVKEHTTGVAIKANNWATGILEFSDDDIAKLNQQIAALLAKLV